MHSFQNFIVRLIPNHPPPLETTIWKLVVRALISTLFGKHWAWFDNLQPRTVVILFLHIIMVKFDT